MKVTNLISILNAFKNLNSDLLNSYLKYYSIEIKTDEFQELEVLVNHLKTISKNISLYDKYYISYKIPQIGKQFDLLRIDDETIVNIELKRTSTPEKIKAQLLRNKYYLSFLKKETFLFSYVADEQKLYTIDTTENLNEVHIRELIAVLVPQTPKKTIDIDSYFNPSSYLVSPFNSTQDFVKGKYFLTHHQEEIKTTILDLFNKSKCSILSIKGKAGTGKTLLTFDLAKEFLKKQEVLIVHCGYLNEGHEKLRDDYGWNIIPAKSLMSHDLSKYSLIIIDEAQRIYPNQLKDVISKVRSISNNCIFSYDKQQTLRKGEISSDVTTKIETEITHKPFELTDKIRTNKEVSVFIQCLFNKNSPISSINNSNVEVYYFENCKEAKTFLVQLKSENWKVINYTPSTKSTLEYELHRIDTEPDNAHTVIGQEFDNVVAVIDEHFYYKTATGDLSTKNYTSQPYYHPTKMLFQIISRTRVKLCIVIINNNEVLKRCMEILLPQK